MLEFSHKSTLYLHIYNLKDWLLGTIYWNTGFELLFYENVKLFTLLIQQQLILVVKFVQNYTWSLSYMNIFHIFLEGKF